MANDPDNPHEWFTAGEAAALARAHGIAGVPITKSGMIKWIKRRAREGLAEGLSSLSRRREGQKGGGGTEYRWCFFQEELWELLDAEAAMRTSKAGWHPAPLTRRAATRGQWTADWPKKPYLDLSAPVGILADDLASAAGLEAKTRFEPFVIRTTLRGRVSLDTVKYFSRDLVDHQGRKVCVVRAVDVPHLVWVCKFDQPKRKADWRHGPGQLICVADERLGRARYVSLGLQREAEAQRAAAQARRRETERPQNSTLSAIPSKEQFPDPDSFAPKPYEKFPSRR